MVLTPEPLPDWWNFRRTTRLDDLKEHRAGKIYEVETEPVAISATEIRSAISAGEWMSADMLPRNRMGLHLYPQFI